MVENIRPKDDSFFGFLNDESQISESHSDSFSDFNYNHLGSHFDIPVKVEDKPKSISKSIVIDQNEGQQQSKLKVRLVELSEDCSFPRKLDASNLKANEVCIMEKDIESSPEEAEIKNKPCLAKPIINDEATKAKDKKCKKNKNKKNKNKKESNPKEQIPVATCSSAYINELQQASHLKTMNEYNIKNSFRSNEKQQIIQHNKIYTHYSKPNPGGHLVYSDPTCSYAYNYNMYPSVQYVMHPINYQHRFPLINQTISYVNPDFPNLAQIPDNYSYSDLNLSNIQLGYNPSVNSRFEFWKNK